MEVGTEEQGQDILLTCAHLMTILIHLVNDHVQVERIGVHLVIGLIHLLVGAVCRSLDPSKFVGILFYVMFKISLCHRFYSS